MAIFPLLADPVSYRPCTTDLRADAAARTYWIDLFERQFEVHMAAAAEAGFAPDARDRARRSLRRALTDVRTDPGRHGRLDLLVLDGLRRAALADGGIEDEFRLAKARENEAALAALPDRLATIAAASDDDVAEHLARGLLAGNLFDMGTPGSGGRMSGGPVAFGDELARVPNRPWFIDDLDPLRRGLLERPPHHVVVLVDNAGPDIVLGVLPLAATLVRVGARVVLAANERPSLNDVTAAELRGLRERAVAADEIFGDSALRIVSTGNASPLIDLTRVDEGLAEAGRGADLLVLVGMGRGVESNWRACFTCPTWRIAMMKDPHVAQSLGARLMDAVCRYAV